MEAQDQPIGPRVFWTIGFLALGTLSAIGAAALFPWYLAIAIAILVTGMASACAFQFRETKNYLYLIAMFAMTGLASFLDGVSVWELLNKRQNTELRGVQAQETVTQDQLDNAEQRALAVREEIASLTAEAQNMDNDGKVDNDRMIPGVLAKIESKKADLANFEAKVTELQAQARAAATTTAVSDAGRHVLLHLADQHPNPAQWLILWASAIFLLPELTLALLAWSLRGNRRGQLRPQPVIIVPHPGTEQVQGQLWQAMPPVAATLPAPPMAYPYPLAANPNLGSQPPAFPNPAALHQAAAPERGQERPAVPFEFVSAPTPPASAPLGMGQMMMAAAQAQESMRSPESPPMQQATIAPTNESRAGTPAAPPVESRVNGGESVEDEDVMLAPDSVPEREPTEVRGPVDRSAPAGRAFEQPPQGSSSDQTAPVPEGQALVEIPQNPGGPPGVEAARNGNAHPQSPKSSPTKLAKSAAAKRSKKAGMRSRNTSLADLASRLN